MTISANRVQLRVKYLPHKVKETLHKNVAYVVHRITLSGTDSMISTKTGFGSDIIFQNQDRIGKQKKLSDHLRQMSSCFTHFCCQRVILFKLKKILKVFSTLTGGLGKSKR